MPNDPGRGVVAGGWQSVQWNFAGPFGVNAPTAWQNLIADGAPGGKGVIVAVLDTGVAYANRGSFRRSPDLSATSFVRGYDFIDDDPYADDSEGHGTHVASTIVEATNNASEPDRPRLRRPRDADSRARPSRRRRLDDDRQRRPLRRRSRRQGHQQQHELSQ